LGHLVALPTVLSPHVLAHWQIKGCDHLGPDGLLQQAESSILSVTCSGDKHYVRFRGRGYELLRKEGWVSHGYLATWLNIQPAVPYLACESIDLMRCCLLASEHLELNIHLKLGIQPNPLHVQSLLELDVNDVVHSDILGVGGQHPAATTQGQTFKGQVGKLPPRGQHGRTPALNAKQLLEVNASRAWSSEKTGYD